MPPQNEPVWRDEPPSPPSPPAPPGAPKRKLKSPILGGGFEEDPDQEPDFKRLRGVPKGGHDSDTGKHKGLRSPLLGGDEIEDESYEEPRAKGGRAQKPTKGGLRSPLLRGTEDDFDDDVPQSRTGGFPHRKSGAHEPIDDDDSPRPPGKGGLRSPLLSGGDYDDPSQFSQLRRSSRPQPRDDERRSDPKVWDPGSGGSDRPRKLRSPVLGGGDYDEYDDDYEDEDDEIEDPNALRSPLLRAVTLPHQNEPVSGPPDLFTQPNIPPQQKQTFPPDMPRPGAPPPFPSTPAQDFSAQPNAEPKMRTGGFAPQQPPEPLRPEPPQPQPSYAPKPDLIPPHARAPEPEPPVQPSVSRSAPSRPSILNEKLEPSRPSFDKFASDSNDSFGGSQPSVSPILAGILVVPILAKLWYMSAMGQALLTSPPFLFDQVCSIVVMVCLILVIMGLSKK